LTKALAKQGKDPLMHRTDNQSLTGQGHDGAGVTRIMVLSAAIRLGIVVSACLGMAACSGAKPQSQGVAQQSVIAISGSDTMVNLSQMWAEEYGKKKPSVQVEVSGGGSGVGIRDLMQGVVQVANSSRELEPAERDQITRKAGKPPIETVVGHDGIAIYVHKDNPIESITLKQLAQIFGEGGDVTSWSQLGVNINSGDKKDDIIRVSRQNSSGTYLYFREHVLKKGDFKAGSCDMSGSKDVVELIARTKTAIGYSGMGYATKEVKMLKIGTDENPAGIEPTQENVTKKVYPLSRALYMCTAGTPDGETKNYLDWILSADGQKIVVSAGYVPLHDGK